MNRYGIWCQIAGTLRGSWFMRPNGKVAMFADLAEAEAEVDRLREAPGASPDLRYFPRRFPALGRRQQPKEDRRA